MQPLPTRLLSIAALAAFPLLARGETVTLFSSGHAPQASSPAYTNTYSLEQIVTQVSYTPTATNIYSFTNYAVTVRSNEVLKLAFTTADGEGLFLQSPGLVPNWPGTLWVEINPSKPTVIVGPARVAFGSSYYWEQDFATFTIQRNDEFTGPQNTVAIPPDASGPVTVKMETSTNLVEWVAAAPGSYGVSASMRYFRLRAVRDTP